MGEKGYYLQRIHLFMSGSVPISTLFKEDFNLNKM